MACRCDLEGITENQDNITMGAQVYRFGTASRVRGLPLIVGPYHFAGPDFPLHTHVYGELALVLSGRGVHVTGQTRYPLAAGDIFYIPPGTVHGFAESYAMSMVNLAFDPVDLLPGDAGDLAGLPGYHALFHLEPALRTPVGVQNRLRLAPSRLSYASQILERMTDEYRRAAPGAATLIRGLFLQLVTMVCRFFSDLSLLDPALGRLAKAVSRIENDYAEDVSLGDLAAVAGLSANQFLRVFRRSYGTSPIRYLLKVRLAQAGLILAETDVPITEVASRCGFSDGNYFSRMFRRHFGVSPRDFRRSLVEGQAPGAGAPDGGEIGLPRGVAAGDLR